MNIPLIYIFDVLCIWIKLCSCILFSQGSNITIWINDISLFAQNSATCNNCAYFTLSSFSFNASVNEDGSYQQIISMMNSSNGICQTTSSSLKNTHSQSDIEFVTATSTDGTFFLLSLFIYSVFINCTLFQMICDQLLYLYMKSAWVNVWLE